MTTGKLDTTLEPTGPKFTDYSLEKYEPDYGNRKKVVKRILNSGIKGLKLKCIKSTKRKFFSICNLIVHFGNIMFVSMDNFKVI